MYLSLCLYGQGGFIILIPLSRICGRMIVVLLIRNFLPSYLSGLARAYRLSLPASDRLAFFVDVLLVPYFLFVYKGFA